MELYNDGKIEKWNWESPSASGRVPRLVTTWDFGAQNTHGQNPAFHGDIMGDWREEVILISPNNDELVIFTTDRPTSIRLYTLAHNPAYRNSMTLKGHVQSHHVDYFIGQDMAKPPRPNICYVGSSPPPTTPTTASPTTPPTTPAPGESEAQRWEQCDGADWTGPSHCVAPWTCQRQNEWYSQCL